MTLPSTATINPFVASATAAAKLIHGTQLPYIRGSWFFVDPLAGLNANDGGTVESAFADLQTAYAAVTSGAGDGICILSGGTSNTAGTTSYQLQPIAWSADGVTVVGVAATGAFGWARVASKTVTSSPTTATVAYTTTTATRSDGGSWVTDGWVVGMTGKVTSTGGTSANNGVLFTVTTVTATVLTASAAPFTIDATPTTETAVFTSYCASLINLSGANNLFMNLNLWNGSTGVANATGIGFSAVNITGPENTFINCHLTGGAGCTQTAYERSLELGVGALDNRFFKCTFGTDTVDRGSNANCELYLNGSNAASGRNYFQECVFLAYAATGTAHGAIKSAAATANGRHMLMRDCDFICYCGAGVGGTDMASMFIGTGLTSGKIIITGASAICGYAYADSSTSNHCVYVSTPVTGASTTGLGAVAAVKTT